MSNAANEIRKQFESFARESGLVNLATNAQGDYTDTFVQSLFHAWLDGYGAAYTEVREIIASAKRRT